MALFSECSLECASKCLTPPTLSERRFITNPPQEHEGYDGAIPRTGRAMNHGYTATGLTVDSLYRCGTPAESEEALRSWLQRRIHEVEAEKWEIEQTAFLAKRAG